MGIHDEANIVLQPPVDKIEFVAHTLIKSYKNDARTWYDLAKAAVAAVKRYEKFYEGEK
jgi:hypothetical protein